MPFLERLLSDRVNTDGRGGAALASGFRRVMAATQPGNGSAISPADRRDKIGALLRGLEMSDADKTAAARLRTAFDLYIAGRRMMRQNLRRRHPEASDREIDSRLRGWLLERPGAEHGDAAGRPIAWPRKASRAT